MGMEGERTVKDLEKSWKKDVASRSFAEFSFFELGSPGM